MISVKVLVGGEDIGIIMNKEEALLLAEFLGNSTDKKIADYMLTKNRDRVDKVHKIITPLYNQIMNNLEG